jgi:hypothetical protein
MTLLSIEGLWHGRTEILTKDLGEEFNTKKLLTKASRTPSPTEVR